jgi:hypothetical protein
MKNRFWAVIIKPYEYQNNCGKPVGRDYSGFCVTWDNKHCENTRKEETVQVWAIYPRKKDALSDCRFRGGSEVKEVRIEIIEKK